MKSPKKIKQKQDARPKKGDEDVHAVEDGMIDEQEENIDNINTTDKLAVGEKEDGQDEQDGQNLIALDNVTYVERNEKRY